MPLRNYLARPDPYRLVSVVYSLGDSPPCHVVVDCPVSELELDILQRQLANRGCHLDKVELLNWALSSRSHHAPEAQRCPALTTVTERLQVMHPVSGTTVRVIEYCGGVLFAEIVHALTLPYEGETPYPPL